MLCSHTSGDGLLKGRASAWDLFSVVKGGEEPAQKEERFFLVKVEARGVGGKTAEKKGL